VTYAEEGADFDPCVSRDGTKLVFASTQHRATSDIYIKRMDSRVMTQLTNDPAEDACPAISPDGSKIAFASNRTGNWDIFVIPISGGKAVQITSDGADEMQPSWSPDGAKLVYARAGASGRWEMWVAKAGNNASANFIGYGVQPRWCPETGTGEGKSDKIVYQLGRERGRRSFSLWTMDYVDGASTNATELVGSADAALINPTWSSDGQWIAYTEVDLLDPRNTGSQRPAASSLWMVSVAGEGKIRLTGTEGVALNPSWGNDGTLYFVSDRSGRDNVWSLNLAQALTSAQAAMGPTSAAAQSPISTSPTPPPAPAVESVANVPETPAGSGH